MENLNECINSEELVDIDIPNRFFTWSNKRRNPTLVKLDRVFINILWSQSFPHTEAKAITASTSDDTPILVQTSQSLPINKIFRLENYWLHMPGFKNMIQTDWARGTRTLSPISILNLKLRRLRAKIRSWSKNKTAIQSLLHINKHVIDFLDCCEEWRPLSALEFTLRAHCTNLLKELNWFWTLKWKRRAKIKWCTLGDENSNFFHVAATIQHRKNKIKVLMDNGVEHFENSQKIQIATSFFQNIFSTPPPQTSNF